MNEYENNLTIVIKPYIEKGRAGDWEHAKRVVKWVKILGKNRKDLPLLLAAAYIHDIGWSGLAPAGKINLNEMLKLEPKANENSSRLIEEALGKLKFSDSEIETVKRLVAAVDKHMSEQEHEAIIVDADNLSKLNIDHLRQKYEPKSYNNFLNLLENELMSRIKTEEGKKIYPELLIKLKKEIQLLEGNENV